MKTKNWWMSVSTDGRVTSNKNADRRDRGRSLGPAIAAAAAAARRFAWRGPTCLVIGMCVYALSFEPAGQGRVAGPNLIGIAVAGEPGAAPSLRAPEKDRVTAEENPVLWRVVAATGSTQYRHGNQDPLGWQAVVVGLAIERYAEIETGADGRLELFNGRDRMILAPDSLVALPEAPPGVPDITILQNAGQVRYEVDSRHANGGLLSRIGRIFLTGSRPESSFEVHTPLFVAAVKGTTFTVQVDNGAAAVDVTEGAVQVTSTRGGRSARVKAGKRATVTASWADAVSVEAGSTIDDDRTAIRRVAAPAVAATRTAIRRATTPRAISNDLWRHFLVPRVGNGSGIGHFGGEAS
jgi:hypothetical protein